MSVGDDLVGLSQAGTAARTETTEVTSAPEFTNRAFVMTVPRDQAGGLVPQGAAGGTPHLEAAVRRLPPQTLVILPRTPPWLSERQRGQY